MGKKKKLMACGALSLAAVAACVPEASGQDLVVYTVDGAAKEYSLGVTNRLVFTGGTIGLADREGSVVETFAFSDVDFITFSYEVTGIADVWDGSRPDGGGNVIHYTDGHTLYVGLYGESGPCRVVICSANGAMVGCVDGVSQGYKDSCTYYTVDISSLPSGIYVGSIGEASFKFMK